MTERVQVEGWVGRYALLYDRDCGFCRWALGVILRWDRGRELRPVALQEGEADRLLGEMPGDRRKASWHLVDPDGRVLSAGSALAPLLRLLPGGRTLAPVAARFGERGYRWVADHRGILGGPVTDGAKRRADALIAERG